MKKNDEIILEIEDLSADGAGVGKCDGMAFFVKDALVGDKIKAKVMKLKKKYGYNDLDAFLVLKDILAVLWKKDGAAE